MAEGADRPRVDDADDSGSADFIEFVVAEEPEADGGQTKAIFGRGSSEFAVASVPTRVLRKNVQRMVGVLREVFADAARESHPLRLSEVQVGFEVSASGGVRMIGTAEMAAKGAITLVFTADK